MGLVEELEKIKALEKYKKELFSYLIRYLCTFMGFTSKESNRIMRRYFGSWYFDGIRSGKVVDFLPITDIVRERDLKYLARKIDKGYVPYKPFHFEFRLRKYKIGLESPTVDRCVSEDEQKVTFQVENYKYTISILQYGRLRDLYRGPPGYFDDYVMILLLKYGFIGTKNNHLSIPPSLLSTKTTELFGSPLNTSCNNYCSPIESDKIFGSKGSFFDFEFYSGTYIANPPFVEDVMIGMANRLLEALESVKTLTIYVIIPVWDSEAVARGVTYVAWDLLRQSKYMQDHRILEQFSYPFYDYYDNKYIPVADTHLILLSNVNIKTVKRPLDPLIEKWEDFKSKIIPIV